MQSRRSFRLKKSSLWALGAGVVIVLLLILELTNTTHIFHKEQQPNLPPAANSNTKGETPTTTSEPSNPGSTTQPGDEKSSSGGGSNTSSLLAPSGNFVSNHQPNLSGSPAPNQLQSVCNTTPGATCQITFEKDGQSKSLPAQVTDRGGSTFWTWKLQDIGLTTGNWQITAQASLNGQNSSTKDALTLDVSP